MNTKKIVAALLLSSSLASAVSASAAYSAMAKYKKHRILTSLCLLTMLALLVGFQHQQLLFYPRNHLWNLYLWRSRISKDFSSRPK